MDVVSVPRGTDTGHRGAPKEVRHRKCGKSRRGAWYNLHTISIRRHKCYLKTKFYP